MLLKRIREGGGEWGERTIIIGGEGAHPWEHLLSNACASLLLPEAAPDDGSNPSWRRFPRNSLGKKKQTAGATARVFFYCCTIYCCLQTPLCAILLPPCGFCWISSYGDENSTARGVDAYWTFTEKKDGADIAARAKAIRLQRKEFRKDITRALITIAGLGIITSGVICCKDLKKLTKEKNFEAANMRVARWIMCLPYNFVAGADVDALPPGLIPGLKAVMQVVRPLRGPAHEAREAPPRAGSSSRGGAGNTLRTYYYMSTTPPSRRSAPATGASAAAAPPTRTASRPRTPAPV